MPRIVELGMSRVKLGHQNESHERGLKNIASKIMIA